MEDINDNGTRIMHVFLNALRCENFLTVQQLLESKSLNGNDWLSDLGVTALHLTVGYGREEFAASVTHELLRHGANANATSADGMTPVHVAAAWGRVTVLHILLLHGGDPWKQDDERKNAFNYAFEAKAWPAVEMLHNFQLVRTAAEARCCHLSASLVVTGDYVPQKDDYDLHNTNVLKRDFSEENNVELSNVTFFMEPSFGIKADEKEITSQYLPGKAKEIFLENSEDLNYKTENCFYVNRPTIPIAPIMCGDLNTSHSGKINQTNSPNSERNRTYTIESPKPFKASDLFTELSSALKLRALRISGIDTLQDTTKDNNRGKEDIKNSRGKKVVETKENGEDSIKLNWANNGEDHKTNDDEYFNEVKDCEDDVLSTDSGKSERALLMEADEKKVPVADVSDVSTSFLSLSCDADVTAASSASYQSCDTSFTDKDQMIDNDEETIRIQLQAFGVHPGPITPTTKSVYVRLLTRLKLKGSASPPPTPALPCIQRSPSPPPALERSPGIFFYPSSYCPELSNALNDPELVAEFEELEVKLSSDFNKLGQTWRGGTAKTCFNYLLLDGRVTRDLPRRAASLPCPNDVWRQFLAAVFYIGKGQASRPFAHLLEALNSWRRNIQPKNPKESVILDIWRAKAGVVCVHVFHNTIPAEAHTREAAMIDALGRQNLRNLRRGEYYGCAASWSASQKRQLGVYLLLKAKDIMLQDGERAIRPHDL